MSKSKNTNRMSKSERFERRAARAMRKMRIEKMADIVAPVMTVADYRREAYA